MHWSIAHLVGDFILQNDWLADGKKRASWICVVHVLIYLVPFLFTSLTWWQLGLIGIEHFAQDRTTIVLWIMRIKGSAAFAQPPCGPWSVIFTDNIFHILFIAWVASLS